MGDDVKSGKYVDGGKLLQEGPSAVDSSNLVSIGDSKSPVEHMSEPAETRHRRMQELELMHFYITETGPSIAFDNETSYELFVKAIPRMAFQSDALLFSLYALAALHRAKTARGGDTFTPPSESASEPLQHHQLYLELAIRYHQEELSRFPRDNVDLLLMTTHLMRLVAFVVLSERSLMPYAPPLEWLRITNSHAPLFRAAWNFVGDDDSTQIAKLFYSTPILWDTTEREGVDKRQDLQHILAWHVDDDPGLWLLEVRQAYESTLSYIGGIFQALHKKEPSGPIRRRIMLFPMLIDKVFVDLVAEGRPRALVILGHYFALVKMLDSFWYVGNTGPREVRAIAAHLSYRWKGMMDLPLRIIDGSQLCSSAFDISEAHLGAAPCRQEG